MYLFMFSVKVVNKWASIVAPKSAKLGRRINISKKVKGENKVFQKHELVSEPIFYFSDTSNE